AASFTRVMMRVNGLTSPARLAFWPAGASGPRQSVPSRLRTEQGGRICCGRAQSIDEGADKADPGEIAQRLARPRVRTDLPTSDRPVEIVSGLDPCPRVSGSSGRPQVPPEDVASTLQHATNLLGG